MKKFFLFLMVLLMILPVLVLPAVAAVDAEDPNWIDYDAPSVDITSEGPEADDETPADLEDSAEPASVPGEPLTWGYLATIAGATAATLLIVQFLKVPLDRIWKIPTRAFVYFIALILLLAGTYFTAGLTVNTALLTAVNAVIVALTAYGSYEVTFARKNK